jgi:DNA end-binding protein Ku
MAPVYWKGYLRLSLVTCAVAMTPAISRSERIGFHNLNSKTGNRLRVQLVDEKSGKPVDDEDLVKGYETGPGKYVMLTDEELEEVALESTRTIDITAFVERDEVDVRYLDQPYFLVPDDDVAEEPFAVIRDAMKATDKVGLGQLVLNDRERIVMLEPRHPGILVWRLRYNYEVRDPGPVLARIGRHKPERAAMGTMLDFIDKRGGRFEPKTFFDPLQAAYRRIIEAKRRRRTPPRIKVGPEPPAGEGGKVISLVDALKRSLASERRAGHAAHSRRSPRGKRAARQR